MQEFYSEWTAAGAAKLAASMNNGPSLRIVTMALGDGGGVAVNPSGATRLVREVYRGAVTVQRPADQPTLIECLMRVPLQAGGWTAREVVLLDADGVVVAVGNLPECAVPLRVSGSTVEAAFKVHLTISSTANVNLTIDPSLIYASQTFVSNQVLAHSNQADPHTVYVLKTAAAQQFAPVAHLHTIANVTGLQAALDARQTVAAANQQVLPLGQIIFFTQG